MNYHHLHPAVLLMGSMAIATTNVQVATAAPLASDLHWSTVVNNGDATPCATDPCRKFNSYNQPSVNANGLVVFRARSKGGQGGEPEHGVYMRDMASGNPLVKILDRNTQVPQPNNLDTVFIEPPSFPRIDIQSNTIASRGNHQPVWNYTLPDGSDTRVGTTGIYTNPFGDLITGASKLGSVPEFSFFAVPEVPGTPFDVFPGAPAVTNGATIVFKGNYTVEGQGKTGVYYRHLDEAPDGGTSPVVLIANNTHTVIPGTGVKFGSTAPPSAAQNQAVFAGFDNEENPTAGGIYKAPLTPYKLNKQPKLKTLVGIGSQVPGEPRNITFNRLGEGVSFDGRFVAFMGAWGMDTNTVRLYCPNEGNKDRIAYCKSSDSGSTYDPDTGNWYQDKQVPINQGIFVHDTATNKTFRIARTVADFSDFTYWNFSGRAPGVGEGEGGDEEDGELARWRSGSFIAVSSKGLNYYVAFKARTGSLNENHVYVNPVDGIYLRNGKGPQQSPILALVETGMDGTSLDPEAVYDADENPATPPVPLPVTEMGIERDGFRKGNLVINTSMGTEEAGWAGIYLADIY
jgi:hypothetical protein